MRIQTLNGAASSEKPDRVWITVVSGESSSDIAAGEPCAFTAVDGMTVKKLANAGAALSDVALAGVANKAISAGKTGIVQVYGICPAALCSAQSKASTDATFATVSIPAGAVLKPDTVNNAFSTGATVAASSFLPFGAFLASTSFATVSGTTGSGSLAATNNLTAVFLRLL